MKQKSFLLSAENLSIGYGKGGKRRIVAQNLSATLYEGELVCLVGPNGAGKTTLLKTLAGTQKPLAGKSKAMETEISTLTPIKRAQTLSFVLSGRPFVQGFTVFELASLGRYPYTNWRGELQESDKKTVLQALSDVKVQHLMERDFSELSDGESQRVLIARALAQDTPILLLDEPTAFLDLPRKVELLSLLRQYAWEKRKGVLMSLHDIDLALRFADRLWVMNPSGSFVVGTPEDLALSGVIGEVFSTDTIHFSEDTGEWKLKENLGARVCVEGDTIPSFWTSRALQRKGYTLVSVSQGSCTLIEIEVSSNSIHWSITFPSGEKIIAPSIEDVLFALSRSF
ncbi:MAG: ABC transporter ATP-binding protein [Aminobacterium sp.]|jgi:iron complex transport system ATP-binding protein|uniref:ABC transporter ATP-binding protein n=1 Tax=unclassified Aminobacterium TaxID=2685012 RepID=UPI001BCB70A3|nr:MULTISPECIES: ABC transporter ATP-binding protein [unclassified Aminobacterium]MDD2206412.1 ABC transporter ATP-binding protein [Aminobacterium sp.]MDD3425398.1 ABC transporter ATP-binding protein [Aminobacterium sp.]MDD3707749.1 ABC transporter ATP-binding protein [Aminobacterium sp.]MDD4228253.1 ABC transporter ATP-binding protein [Aminobacterium sp.]MDD4551290.1 ABC transporter ATP-binding protein [Aminobacterium sp.]